jgi:hypothetical protein
MLTALLIWLVASLIFGLIVARCIAFAQGSLPRDKEPRP